MADIRKTADEDFPGLAEEAGFKSVMNAITRLDRAEFVPGPQRSHAYRDNPLPIGFNQTISDPYIVAVMTDAVRVRPGSNVLEVGTGSGYQAAVLSLMGAHVHSVEIVPELANTADRRLRRLHFRRVSIKAGDGYAGWPDFAPFDSVIVTAGASEVPRPLLAQMKPGAKLVMPVGANTAVEQLLVLTKRADGSFERCSLGPVMFVPLTGAGQAAEIPALYDRSVALCRKGQTARWPGQPIG